MTTTTSTPGPSLSRPTEAKMAAFGDLALIEEIYALVKRVERGDDRASLQDEFYWYLTEAFERFAPEVEWATVERQYEDDENRDTELRDARESFERRQAIRLQLRRHFTIGSAS